MERDAVSHSEIREWANWAGKALLIGIISLAVSYLREMSVHIVSLDKEILRIGTEASKTAVFQSNINESIMRQLDKIDARLYDVERKCCKN